MNVRLSSLMLSAGILTKIAPWRTVGCGLYFFAESPSLAGAWSPPESLVRETRGMDRSWVDRLRGAAGTRLARGYADGGGLGRGPRALADLESDVAPDGNILAQFVDHLAHELSHCNRLILNEVLFVKAVFLVEFFHLAIHDFFDDRLGFSRGARLRFVNFALAVQNFLGDFFAPDVASVERGDVHGHVVAQALEIFGSRNEVRFAIHFDDHADFPAGMNVMADQALGGLARRLLLSRGLSFFPEHIDRGFHIAARLDQRGTAVGESRAGALAQVLHHLCRDIDRFVWIRHDCIHSFIGDFRNSGAVVRPQPGHREAGWFRSIRRHALRNCRAQVRRWAQGRSRVPRRAR